jgi:hypothetical protein
LFQVPAQKLEDFLLASLDFKEDRFRHPRVVLTGMDVSRLEEHSAEIGHTLLPGQHLVVGLNHGSTGSTIPRFPKFLEV